MSWDPTWEKIHKSREWGKYPSEPLIRFVFQNFLNNQNLEKIRILELGCGAGANLWFLVREGIHAYGIDGSSSAISKAKARLDSECPNWHGEVINGDFMKLPYRDDYFDAVIDIESVTHNGFEDSINIYSEAYRVIKPGGMIFSQTFATGTWGDGSGKQIEKNGWIPTEGPTSLGEFIRFTRHEDLSKLLGGFSNLQVEKLTRTLNGQSKNIIEWLIVAKK
jgi:ubiquinone/menaquinone biosynthesis C-methylase UbiE